MFDAYLESNLQYRKKFFNLNDECQNVIDDNYYDILIDNLGKYIEGIEKNIDILTENKPNPSLVAESQKDNEETPSEKQEDLDDSDILLDSSSIKEGRIIKETQSDQNGYQSSDQVSEEQSDTQRTNQKNAKNPTKNEKDQPKHQRLTLDSESSLIQISLSNIKQPNNQDLIGNQISQNSNQSEKIVKQQSKTKENQDIVKQEQSTSRKQSDQQQTIENETKDLEYQLVQGLETEETLECHKLYIEIFEKTIKKAGKLKQMFQQENQNVEIILNQIKNRNSL